ncbi:YdeI/OmpD-associated family protein [Lapidilactobacillus mulanensis]|uniref:YdeI/OmpD-associated family protein n=1 Tax=Lapidilactobacillus mulanensis TaxID=2485999 RepID=A0ABW4DLJ6_9LACO|nr:YdeI/OmpD-associated family protein [Lapidilactobacillus mulanensis]
MVKTLAEYEADIPATRQLLTDRSEMVAFFDALTPGYQREWAKFIFGSKAAATKEKHIAEMKGVLAAGYKSKRGYASAMKLKKEQG